MDLSNQRVVTQHCPGDIWKSCIYFEKVLFNRNVAAVEKHGYCELLVVNDPTCPSLLTVFPRSTLIGLLKPTHGAVPCVSENPPPVSHLLQSVLCSPHPLFAQS